MFVCSLRTSCVYYLSAGVFNHNKMLEGVSKHVSYDPFDFPYQKAIYDSFGFPCIYLGTLGLFTAAIVHWKCRFF